jgi:predicted phage-related endonuclease
MMGASKYTSRGDLLHQKALGLVPEVSAATQALFNRGHAAEDAARPIVEKMIGEALYPATAVHDEDDRLLASFDGASMAEDVIFEHKLWSEPLAAQVQSGILDMHYVWQLEQQLLVSGAERAIFVCSDGTTEHFVHMEYRPVPGRREALLAGWDQFARDLAAYVPPAAVEKIVAEPVEALPAPVVQVSGQLTLTDNFKVFEQRLRHFLEHRLIREPKTDQDFADLDLQIKAMKQAREALKAAEAQMLAQVQPVDQAKKTKDMLDKLLQQNCSMAEQLLKDEKERRRGEIVAGGIGALKAHIDALNARLGRPYMPQVLADFGGCIKGLKSLASMEDKVATTLANAKIAANEIADRIQLNLKAMDEMCADPMLFPDHAQLVLKAPDDCRATILSRIAEQERRETARLEAERARIRAEEEARAREQAQREQQEREAAVHAQARAEKEARDAEERREQAALAESLRRELATAAPTPAANVLPMPTKAPAPASTAPTLKLGQINQRIEPLQITADGLAALGFPAAGRDGAARLYHEADFSRICAALVQRIQQAVLQQEAA